MTEPKDKREQGPVRVFKIYERPDADQFWFQRRITDELERTDLQREVTPGIWFSLEDFWTALNWAATLGHARGVNGEGPLYITEAFKADWLARVDSGGKW